MMDLVSDRDRLLEWARAKGDDGLVDYRASKNERSIDDLRVSRSYSNRVAARRMDELRVDGAALGGRSPVPTARAMPLERLTMLVLPREGDARLVVPRLEAPRVVARPDLEIVRGRRPTIRSSSSRS